MTFVIQWYLLYMQYIMSRIILVLDIKISSWAELISFLEVLYQMGFCGHMQPTGHVSYPAPALLLGRIRMELCWLQDLVLEAKFLPFGVIENIILAAVLE